MSEQSTSNRALRWMPVGVGVVAGVVYAFTLARTVPAGDSGELISAAWVGGVAHPPGYPLFTMIGWLATHAVPASPALVMNALSALWHAVAVGVLALLTARLVAPEWPKGPSAILATVAGASAGLLLAFSSGFWLYALVAEVFALNNLLAVSILFLALEWCRHPERTRLILWIGLFAGLGLAHQQTIVTLVPGVAVLFVGGLRRSWISKGRTVRRSARRHLAVGIGLGVLGLSTYLYLPLAAAADPVVNWGNPETLDRFVEVVSRQAYGTFDLVAGGERGSALENLVLYFGYLGRAFTPLGIIAAAIGIGWLWRRYRTESWALILAWVVSGPVFVVYARAPLDDPVTVGILERFYLLSSLVVAIWAGAGVFVGVGALARRRRSALVGGGSILGLLIVLMVGLRWPTVDQSENRVADTYARNVLSTVEPDGMLLMRGDQNFTSIGYMQFVEGLRPDVVALDTELLKTETYVDDAERRFPALDIPFESYAVEDASLGDLIETEIGSRRVYAVGVMPEDLSERFDVVRLGLLDEIRPPTGVSEYSALLADPSIVTDLDPQEDTFENSTWENTILREYGVAHFDLAFAYQSTGTGDAETVEGLYRRAIELGQVQNAYKNLGVLKLEQGDRAEAARLFEIYLELNPEDPEAAEIQSVIDSMP